jgi:hypothetical protein
MSQIEFHNFKNPLDKNVSGDLAVIFNAYKANNLNEYILEVGRNERSGYSYIALENGICICSNGHESAVYLATNFENGEEFFFDTYQEAEQQQYDINQQSL